jgi:hypothetical protein
LLFFDFVDPSPNKKEVDLALGIDLNAKKQPRDVKTEAV